MNTVINQANIGWSRLPKFGETHFGLSWTTIRSLCKPDGSGIRYTIIKRDPKNSKGIIMYDQQSLYEYLRRESVGTKDV